VCTSAKGSEKKRKGRITGVTEKSSHPPLWRGRKILSKKEKETTLRIQKKKRGGIVGGGTGGDIPGRGK